MNVHDRIINKLKSIVKSLLFNFSNLNLRKIFQAISHIRIIMAGEKVRKINQVKYNVNIPPFCIFSVTWKCNLQCVGCCAKDYAHKEDMSLDVLRKTIEDAVQVGTYFFMIVGGEPLTVSGLIDMLGGIKNAIFLLFTNGTLINESKIESIKKYVNIIPVISIEGDIKLSDIRRGHGVGEKIVEAIELFKKRKIAFGFSTMATHTNLDYITTREYFEKLRKFGALFGFIIDYIPFKNTLNEDFLLTKEDFVKKRNNLELRKKDVNLMILNFPADEYHHEGCGSAGKDFVHINADGFVEPCPFSHYAVDNIKTKKYLEVLQSNFFKRLRELTKRRNNEGGLCLLFENEDLVKKIAFENGGIKTTSK